MAQGWLWCVDDNDLSQCMRFPTMWYVRPAKPQISLRICAVWSGPLLVPWVFYDRKATDWTPFGVSKLKRRLHRLIWVYTCQNATLLAISCTGSYWKVKSQCNYTLKYFCQARNAISKAILWRCFTFLYSYWQWCLKMTTAFSGRQYDIRVIC